MSPIFSQLQQHTNLHPTAVTHELVQPTEHHVTHEQVTREIHYHDVFHRVLPVIDLEILPTKHYVVDPDRPGTLKEIPESEAPVRNNWTITPNIALVSDESVGTDNPQVHKFSELRHCHADEQAEPVLVSKKSYITSNGATRTEYVWQHPPTFDMSAYDQGQTMPLRMNCVSPIEFSEYLASQSQDARANHERSCNTVHGDFQEVGELQRHNQASLIRHHSIVSHKPAAVDISTERPGSRTQSTRGPNRFSKGEKDIAEEALIAAETAIAVAEEVIATAQDMPQKSSHARSRTSWNIVSDTKGEEVRPQRFSWHPGMDGVGNFRGKMRARLHKAKELLGYSRRR